MERKGESLGTASADDLHAYIVALNQRDMAASTAARHLSSQRRFFKFLQAEGLREDDPSASLKRPRLQRPLPKLLSFEETERLIAAAHDLPRDSDKQAHDRLRTICLIEVLYATGLRVSELVGLPRRAARGDRRMLLARGKGGRERMVPLSVPAIRALVAWRALGTFKVRVTMAAVTAEPLKVGHQQRVRCPELRRLVDGEPAALTL